MSNIFESVEGLKMLRASIVPEEPAIDPPRSWPKEWKLRFLLLPTDLQVFIAGHEEKREKELRRAQNERAEAVKELEKLNDATQANDRGTGEPATIGDRRSDRPAGERDEARQS